MDYKEALKMYRYFLKDSVRKKVNFGQTDQNIGVKTPPVEKPVRDGAILFDLPGTDIWQIPEKDLTSAIGGRQSHRKYKTEPLTMDELSYLLWTTQSVRGETSETRAYRNVPSAGCRHSFETYLAVLNIKGLEPGIYRYLPLSHQLVFEFSVDMLAEKIVIASFGQPYPGGAAVTFIWTSIPYRMEWRYGIAAHKVIAIDVGHVCQNLYLACEAIGAGTCAIAAYDQEEMDALIDVDGEDEFSIYLAPVGKI